MANKKITIVKTTCGVIAFGKRFRLVKGENLIDAKDWEEFKNFPHVVARINAGELTEGEQHISAPVESSPEPIDSDVGSDDDSGVIKKKKRKKEDD